MPISHDARIASADLHSLTASTPRGATRPVQPFGVATASAAVHEMPETFVSLGTAAAGIVAGIGTRRPAPADLDAEVIFLADRIAALAPMTSRIAVRLAKREDAVDAELPALSPQPQPENRTKCTNVVTEGWYTSTFSYPTTPDEAHNAAMAVWNAEVAEAKRVEATVKARYRIPQWEALEKRTYRRLIRRAWRLTYMEPRTKVGLKAKAAAAVAVTQAGASDVWANELHASVSRDALRIIGAQADARAREDQVRDGYLLHLGRRWEEKAQQHRDADEAMADAWQRFVATAPDVPEELFVTDQDHRRAWPYASDHIGSKRRWFGDAVSIEMLRQGYPKDLSEERRREILAAHDRWVSDTEAAQRESGASQAEVAAEVASREAREARQAIVLAPARTMAGLLLKTHAILFGWSRYGTQEVEEKLARARTDGDATDEAAMAILLDLARMSLSTSDADITPMPTASAA